MRQMIIVVYKDQGDSRSIPRYDEAVSVLKVAPK